MVGGVVGDQWGCLRMLGLGDPIQRVELEGDKILARVVSLEAVSDLVGLVRTKVALGMKPAEDLDVDLYPVGNLVAVVVPAVEVVREVVAFRSEYLLPFGPFTGWQGVTDGKAAEAVLVVPPIAVGLG